MGFYPVVPLSVPASGGIFTGPISTQGITNTVTAITSSVAITTSAAAGITGSGGFNAGVGSVDVPQAGGGLKVAEGSGSNSKQGVFTLTGGATQAIPNTTVTASSRIIIGPQVDAGTPGRVGIASRSAGVSFTVSCLATDTSTYCYEIFEPG